MTALYWFALVVGAGMYLFSAFAGHGHGDGHAADVHHSGDADHGTEAFRILSIRNATYFLFAFGVSGVLLNWMWGGRWGLLTALVATTLGALGGAISALTFGWLRRSESGEMPGDASLQGALGRVTIPLAASGTGKIIVTRGGRELELLARPFDEAAEQPERWTEVLVVDMRQGVALVAPNESSLDDPDAPRLGAPSET